MSSGLPDIDTLDTYGGALVNYGGAVEDPTTDRDATAMNRALMNVGALTQTCNRCWVRFLGHATTPTLASTNVAAGTWPDQIGNRPTPARTGLGVYTLTYPTSITDELGVAHNLNLRAAKAYAEGATAYHCQASATAANVITVRVFDMAGAANDAAGVTILVEGF